MPAERPDNYDPSPEDLRGAEELFRSIGADNVLSDQENLDVERAREETNPSEMRRRRMEIWEEIFQASDLLEKMPDSFRQKAALRAIFRAASSFIDPANSDFGTVLRAEPALKEAMKELQKYRPDYVED